MTVEELWEQARSLVGKSPVPADRLRETLSQLVGTPQGRSRFLRGIAADQRLPGRPILLRHFARLMEPSGELSAGMGSKERSELLEGATRAARSEWRVEATYWVLLWLRLRNGQTPAAAEAATDLRTLNQGCPTPQDLAKRLTGLQGWADVPGDRWVELLDRARAAEPSADFRSHLQQVVDRLKSVEEKASAPPATTPATGQPQGVASSVPNETSEKAFPSGIAISAQSVPVVTAPREAQAQRPTPRTSGDGPSPAGSTERTEEKESQPPTTAETAITPPAGPGTSPSDVRQGASEVKEARPKRAASQKRASKEVVPTEAGGVGAATELGGRTTKSEGAGRTSAGLPAGCGEELPTVLTELAAAVRAVSHLMLTAENSPAGTFTRS